MNPFHKHSWEAIDETLLNSIYTLSPAQPNIKENRLPSARINYLCTSCGKRMTMYRYWRWTTWKRDGIRDSERELVSFEDKSDWLG